MITLNELCKKINNWAESKGWNAEEVPFSETCILINSEVCEAFEEYRNHRGLNEVYFKDGKPEGIPIEMADTIIRICHWAAKNEIDLEHAVELKHIYNTTRPYRHGDKKA